jgi:pimeloyl-ACP methyl ester carboxylesterase
MKPVAAVFEHQIAVPGGRLWCRESRADGPPVILMHAATGSALNWEPQRESLSDAGYRVIAYSRRGHHRSSPVPDGNSISAVADLQNLADASELDRFHLVGVAAGGFFATDYALTHPSRLRSLTVACSMMGIADPAWRASVEAIHPPAFRQMPMDFVEVGPSYRLAYPVGLQRWRELHEIAHDGGAESLQPLENEITWDRLERVSLPVLLIAGGADLIVPTPAMRATATHIPSARLVEIPDAGHSAAWERPAEFNRALLEFLSSADTRDANG